MAVPKTTKNRLIGCDKMREDVKERMRNREAGLTPTGYRYYHKVGTFPSDWKVKLLRELSVQVTEKVGKRKLETLSISAGVGFANQAQKFGKELSGKQYVKYTVLRRGDFSYNKGNSNMYPQGCIYCLQDREIAAVPDVFNSFRLRDEQCNIDFYSHLFIAGIMNHQLFPKINSGVRNDGLLNLYTDDFYGCTLPVPSLPEQQKIAEILNHCDKVIELNRQLIEEERNRKKWFIRNLLEPGAKVRLPGFSGEWTRCILGDICSINGRIGFRGYSVDDLVEENAGAISLSPSNISNGNMNFDHSTYISWEKYEESPEIKVRQGDILFVKTGSTFGKCAKVAFLPKEATINPQLAIIRAKNVNTDYLAHLLSSNLVQNRVQQVVVGGAVPTLSQEQIYRLEIAIPSLEEQTAISVILNNSDCIINSLEQKLAQWQLKKKALSQLLLTGLVRVTA
jgi:type I restriction enzyme S subunit